MLEQETIKTINTLIRGMANFCIKAYGNGQSVDKNDLEALANLISSINTNEYGGLSNAIGFEMQTEQGDEE